MRNAMLTTNRLLRTVPLWLMVLATIFIATAVFAQDRGTWNLSPDPDAPKGHCRAVSSAFGPRWVLVNDLGETTADVLAIQVLRCAPFSGGGLSKVDCAAYHGNGVPYAYCARSLNDGLGNDITIGVLKRDATTDANRPYTGCPAGASVQPKLDLVKAAGIDPRRLSGLVVLSCTAAAPNGGAVRPTPVACPPEPQPYGRCIGTTDDGHGNAVTLGLVHANGPGDPNGLYGECDTAPPIQPGMLYKSDVIAAAGKSLANVRSIDLEYCAMGGPEAFHALPCEDIATFPAIVAARLDYCVVGTDVHGNHIAFGVSGK